MRPNELKLSPRLARARLAISVGILLVEKEETSRLDVGWSDWLDAGRFLAFIYDHAELMVGKDVKSEKIDSDHHERQILVRRICL